MAPTKGGEKKGHSAINKVVTHEYTMHIHGMEFRKHAPWAFKEIGKFQ
jgi:large subunit ribosomal protein L31e